MKKYKVSLAILQPKNYEVEIEAESEEEAIKLAIEDWNLEASGEVVGVDGIDVSEKKVEVRVRWFWRGRLGGWRVREGWWVGRMVEEEKVENE